MRGRAWVVVRLVGLIAALALLGTAPADAHAYLQGSNPADGATLSASPATLRLSFSEHVVLEATHLALVDGDGHKVPVTDLRLTTRDAADIEAPASIVARLPHLQRSTYRLAWDTLSSDDLHRTAGIVVFGVGRAVDTAPVQVAETPPRPEEAALRWLLFLGVALALGGALARRVCAGRAGLTDLAGGTRLVSRVGAAGAALLAVGLLADQLAPGDVGLRQLLADGYGTRWLVREAGLLALVGAAFAETRLPSGLRRGLLVLGAALTGVGSALLGHAAAGPGTGSGIDVTRVLATGLHLVASLTWAGGVVCLALVIGAARRSGTLVTTDLRAALRAFGRPAAACVTVAAVTGVYLASSVVGSVDAALRTFYGRTLLLKLLLVGAAGLLALVNHLRLRGRHDLDVPRRTVRAEAAVALLVVAVTGLLVSGQPATQPALVDRPHVATHGTLHRHVGDLQEAVSLRPSRPGRNAVVVDVAATRRPSGGPVTGVDVSLAGGAAVPAGALSDGHWIADLADLAAGPTVLTVTVHRAGRPDARSDYAWTVGGPAATLPAWVSTAPLDGVLRRLAAALALVAVVAWGIASTGRSSRGQPPAGPGRRRGRRTTGVGTGFAVMLVVLGTGAPSHSPGGPADVTARIQDGPAATAPGQQPGGTAPGAPLSVLAGPAIARQGSVVDVPRVLYDAYQAAVATSPPSCHLRISLLAAIGTVESGSLDARTVDAQHRTQVFGPLLNGGQFATIRDTDNGVLDGSRRWDRAVGPMQFLPSTWRRYGRDGDHDGVANPQDIEDAAVSAAGFLCARGRDLAVPSELRAAVLAYNHSRAYLRLVLTLVQRFESSGLRPAVVGASIGIPLSAVTATLDLPSAAELARHAGVGGRPAAARPHGAGIGATVQAPPASTPGSTPVTPTPQSPGSAPPPSSPTDGPPPCPPATTSPTPDPSPAPADQTSAPTTDPAPSGPASDPAGPSPSPDPSPPPATQPGDTPGCPATPAPPPSAPTSEPTTAPGPSAGSATP